MAETEHDILGEAIAGTEKEIFGEATGGEPEALDESGDRSVEEMGEGLEGQHETDEDDGEAKGDESDAEADAEAQRGAAEAAKNEQERDADGKFKGKPGEDRRVPLGELKSEREKRQAAEAQITALEAKYATEREADRKALAEMNARFDQVLKATQPKVDAPQPAKDEAPDIFTDPVGYQKYQDQRFQTAMRISRAETQMQLAEIKDPAMFKPAYAAMNALRHDVPAELKVLKEIANSPDVGQAMIAWHRQNETLRRVGNDPDAYEAKLREETRTALMKDPEFRKQLLADLQAEAGTGRQGAPRNIIRNPVSLNGASGSSSAQRVDSRDSDDSDRGVFAFATG